MADSDSRAGLRYADPDITAFVDRVHAAHDAALARAFDSPATHAMPAIQVSPSEGKFLGLLMRIAGARRVVEVGTLAGYSALHIARGLPPDGKLYSVEFDPRHAAVARANIEAAGLTAQVEVHVGEALDVLPRLNGFGPFDAVFLDADKQGYPLYAAWAAKNLRQGGLLIADNSYLFGTLMHDEPTARAMRQFHESLPANFDSSCVPTPDGLVVAMRH